MAKVGRYDLVDVKRKDGSFVSCVQIPLGELLEVTAGQRKQGRLRQAISRLFGRERRERTSAVNDEMTTDTSYLAGGRGNIGSFNYYERMALEARRKARYDDFERMIRESTVLDRALKVTVNNTFMSRDGDQESFEVKSDDARIGKILDELVRRLDLQNVTPQSYRSCLKYGDLFEELVYDPGRIIVRMKWLNPAMMERNEDEFGRLDTDVAFRMADDATQSFIPFEFWQVVHLRHDHERGDRYGRSFFWGARRPFRILQAMEDGVAINRMVNAVDRLVFYIPVPKNLDPIEMDLHIDQVKKKFKRRINVDANGKLDLTKNPMGEDEDLFIGVWEDSPAKVERLPGGTVIGQLNDVEYFQNLQIMATGVPKSYLGLERDINAKATLGWQDIEYARQIRTNHREASSFVRTICNRQLEALGIPYDNESFVVEFPSISFVDEEMRATVQQIKWTVAATAHTSLGIPTEWLLENLLGLDDEDVTAIMANLKEPEPKQMPPTIGGIPTGEPRGRELGRVKEALYNDMRVAGYLNDVRDKLDAVLAFQLNQPHAG